MFNAQILIAALAFTASFYTHPGQLVRVLVLVDGEDGDVEPEHERQKDDRSMPAVIAALP